MRSLWRWQVERIAGNRGISTISLGAYANRRMVNHTANCINATHTGTRFHALGVQASLFSGTVTVKNTFWPTTNMWVSEVTLTTDAGQTAVLTLALRIGTAMEFSTAGLRWRLDHRLSCALFVRIAK